MPLLALALVFITLPFHHGTFHVLVLFWRFY
jgi:hypothetical protein